MTSFLEYLKEYYQPGKVSKSYEEENGKDSTINHHLKYRDWHIVPKIHAASQAKDRRPEFKLDDWKKLHAKVHAAVTNDTHKTNGEHLFYSKSQQQGYVANVDHEKKELRIMTVLPKGRSKPLEGTKAYTVEGVEAEPILVELE